MKPMASNPRKKLDKSTAYEVRPEQSVDLLKALHILTSDGKINQDSRRKLKQINHLFNFIKPLLDNVFEQKNHIYMVDHGAGKSYLGFLIYDLYFKPLGLIAEQAMIYGIETRDELVTRSQQLAQKAGFTGMQFLNLSVADSIESQLLPESIDIVTALHACNTATDDAIKFALTKNAQHIVLVPCCQAEVASVLRANKSQQLANPLAEIWRHPIHTREFGSHITNVLRCLQLQAHGYDVSVTELVGWEHSMKNELIIASRKYHTNGRIQYNRNAAQRLHELLNTLGLDTLNTRFFTPNLAAGV
ncbi:MAG: SAM-dependent methyltransferase [Burkholderiales bacterium]|nr:SAM-dependent methyltransferase [Burkholderiales bacterium]